MDLLLDQYESQYRISYAGLLSIALIFGNRKEWEYKAPLMTRILKLV